MGHGEVKPRSEKGLLGRDCKGWVIITIFYLIFFSILAGFFAACLVTLMKTLPDGMPRWNADTEQPILTQPGLGFLPHSVGGYVTRQTAFSFSPMLEFDPSDSESYSGAVQQLKTFLQQYAGKSSVNVHDCNDTTSLSACPVDLSLLESCGNITGNFGYDTGEPCILLKLNKIYGWKPESDPIDPIPPINPMDPGNYTYVDGQYKNVTMFGYKWSPDNVYLSCQESNPTTGVQAESSLLDVTFYPNYGFPYTCFPYCGNQQAETYLHPLVMAKFKVVRKQEVYVWCKAWSKNIKHSRRDKAGSVRFTLKVQ